MMNFGELKKLKLKKKKSKFACNVEYTLESGSRWTEEVDRGQITYGFANYS